MSQLPRRTLSQKTGSQGHRWAMAAIEKHADWLARALDEDFGIDAEAEYVRGEARGDILKLQFKATARVVIREGRVRFSVDRGYLQYARNCRYPVIFVLIDVGREEAWYLWLQQWIFENRKESGADAKSSTIWVNLECTLASGLDGELKSIAKWEGSTQLALSLLDAFRAALATHAEDVLIPLTELLEKVAPQLPEVTIDRVIEQAISLGSQLWATPAGNTVAGQLYRLVRKFGSHVSLVAIDTMVSRGDSYSRTGVNALGILYDEHFDHARSLGLVALFDAKEPRVAYYCALREAFPAKSGLAWISVPNDFWHAGLRFDFDDSATTGFHDKLANRGASAILDYLILEDGQPPET